jgi:hypothetical protein
MLKYNFMTPFLILFLSTNLLADNSKRKPAQALSDGKQNIANEAADGFCRAFVKSWNGHESIPVRAEGATSIPGQAGTYTVSCHNTDPNPGHTFNAEIKVKFSPLGALDSVSLGSVIE